MSGSPELPPDTLAITGMAGRFPGAADIFALWRNLEAGAESIARLDEAMPPAPAPEGGQFVPAKGILDDADCFDAAFFGLSPRAAAITDPQHRLFLECAFQALEDAGQLPERPGAPIGVFAGASMVSSYYHDHLRANHAATRADDPFQMMLSNQPSGIANLVSYRLGLTGPSLALHTACSTGLVAVATACMHILDGQCDTAVAGASSVSLPLRAGYWHVPGGILSADGHCRAFAADADGTVPGNGVGAVVLRRLEDALEAGDHIYAVIRGYAVNNDGSDKIGYSAPGVGGQTRAIAEALAMADVPGRTISYVETHGTGTALGDAIEIEGLQRALRPRQEADSANVPCMLGSIKANLGHLDASAGIAGLIKLALMLDRKVLPPSPHVGPPSPHLTGTPFALGQRSRHWPRSETPRRAGVSSFGMGGTNAHLILEEAPATPDERARADRPVMLPISGRDPAALARMAGKLAAHLEAHPALPLGDVALTLGAARRPQACRRAVVARDRDDAITSLHDLAGAVAGADAPPNGSGELAVVFLFPGQGAQIPHIAQQVAAAEPVFHSSLEQSLAILRDEGIDLEPLLLGSAGNATEASRQLNETRLAQPAGLCLSLALARLLASWGIRPAAMLGHSVGEYAAACLAGVMTAEEALRLVAERGRLVQVLPRGGMLAVAAGAKQIEAELGDAADVAIAGYNGVESTVIAGPVEVVEEWQQRFEAKAIPCRRLATSHAFHSAMMEPAMAPLAATLSRLALQPPGIPYISGASGDWILPEEAISPAYYARHLRQPVQFAAGIDALITAGYRRFLEVGAGAALSRLALRQARSVTGNPAGGSEPHLVALATLASADAAGPRRALGGLWQDGMPLDWRALEPEARRVPLPPYPFERARHWIPAPDEAEAGPPVQRLPEPPSASPGDMTHAPQTILHEIRQLWQQQLGYAEIGPDSDFHSLGGDSLLAVRLVALLNRRFGTALPPHALLEAPTPRSLARCIEAACGQASASGSDTVQPFAVVRLRAGEPGHAPLFLPHAVGGTVHFYAELATALEPGPAVYALQSPALDGVTPIEVSVESVAAQLVTAMRAVQPEGPYRLAGSSFGGMLAYEMACQLNEARLPVTLLALIDTPAMEELPRTLADDAEIIGYVAGVLGHTLNPDTIRPLTRQMQIERLIDTCQDALPADMTPAELDLHLRIFAANTEAMRRYVIRPCEAPERIHFCRARTRDAHMPANPERPWQARLGSRLALTETTGDHLSMMRPPHVHELAAWLDQALHDAARAPGS